MEGSGRPPGFGGLAAKEAGKRSIVSLVILAHLVWVFQVFFGMRGDVPFRIRCVAYTPTRAAARR